MSGIKKFQLVEKLEHLSSLQRTKQNCSRIKSDLKSLLHYDYEISKTRDEWFSDESADQKLGQISTPLWTADLISKLCIRSPNDIVLDPCFGDGVFLKTASDRIKKLAKTKRVNNIYGVEIDPFEFPKGLGSFLKTSEKRDLKKTFFCGNIFDFKKKNFDAVILNPPYTRQEALADFRNEFLNKKIIQKKILESIDVVLSLRSNLYLYFIVYLTSLVKNGGYVGAIIPKGWLDSKYGIEFQKFLLDSYEIKFIIDFEKDTFSSVIVEDCVIILKKNPNSKEQTKFVHIKKESKVEETIKLIESNDDFDDEILRIVNVHSDVLKKDHKWGKFLLLSSNMISILQNEKLVPLSKLASINRGIGTNWNNLFILKEDDVKKQNIEKKFLRPIISSPHNLSMLETKKGVILDHLLCIENPIELSDTKGVKNYLEQFKQTLKTSGEHQVIANAFTKNPNSWYIIRPTNPAPIIFSYIIRKMKNFIFNSGDHLVRDNFYNIYPLEVDPLVLFAVLNSSIVRLNLELTGRRYGNGLLKIQAYELGGIAIPDIRIMRKSVKLRLKKYATELLQYKINNPNIFKTIEKIDSVIHEFCNLEITSKKIVEIENSLVNMRLGRR